MELIALPLMLLVISSIQAGHTDERPKAAVIVEQNNHENVTARCEIPGAEDDWMYSWFIEGSTFPFSTDREFSISTDVSHSSANITCRGDRRRDGLRSNISDAVTLLYYVTEAPKAILTVQSASSEILTGETVTLTCDIEEKSWAYIWQCGNEQHTSAEKEINITLQFNQTCMCYSCTKSFCSQWSDIVTLTVSGAESPFPVLSGLKLGTFLLAASPYLLVSVILGIKCYRFNVAGSVISPWII